MKGGRQVLTRSWPHQSWPHQEGVEGTTGAAVEVEVDGAGLVDSGGLVDGAGVLGVASGFEGVAAFSGGEAAAPAGAGEDEYA